MPADPGHTVQDPPKLRARWQKAQRRSVRAAPRDRFLHHQLQTELLQRLDWVQLEPKRILSFGSDHGSAIESLRQRFSSAEIVAFDSCPNAMPPAAAWRLCGNREAVPLCDASVDMVFANLSLAYSANLVQCLLEARRVLATPGLFTFATLGRDAFKELRAAWSAADNFTHVAAQPDMHDLGDLLLHSGFAEPVIDTDVLQVTYASFADLIRDLRAAAAVNSSAGYNPGLMGRAAWQRLTGALDAQRDSAGRFPISIEIIYGQAWSSPRSGQRSTNGVFEVYPADIAGPRGKSGS